MITEEFKAKLDEARALQVRKYESLPHGKIMPADEFQKTILPFEVEENRLLNWFLDTMGDRTGEELAILSKDVPSFMKNRESFRRALGDVFDVRMLALLERLVGMMEDEQKGE